MWSFLSPLYKKLEPEHILEELILTAVLLGAWWCVQRNRRLAQRIRATVLQLSQKKILCALLLALAPIVTRVALLHRVPVRGPLIHDEFVHILTADTLLNHRLANPPHPMSRFFETIYVLQHPSYSSIYPLGLGAFLALGRKLTGQYFWGVWLSVAFMIAAIYWMLSGYLTDEWALAGGWIATALLGGATPWMYSYFGGAVPALGGALVFGALPRIWIRPRASLFALAAVGWSIVWFSRPFESLILAAIVLTVCVFAWRRRHELLMLTAVRRGLIVVFCIVALVGGFTALRNYRVTRHPLEAPYLLSQRQYGVPQSLIFQKPVPEGPDVQTPEQHGMYLWQLERRNYISTLPGFLYEAGRRLFRIWLFFVNYALTLPFLVALFVWRGGTYKLLVFATCVAGFLGSLPYAFFIEHYYAPYACLAVLVSIEGLRRLSTCRLKRLSGTSLAAACILCAWLTAFRYGMPPDRPESGLRDVVEQQLSRRPGKKLVFVLYGTAHAMHREWLYNEADIDAARIVWARSLGPTHDRDLIHYYADRTAWIIPDPDIRHPDLKKYMPNGSTSKLR